MRYFRELYGAEGASMVINNGSTYKGWWPPNTAAAAKALVNVSGTGIDTTAEAEKVAKKEKLPPSVSTSTAESVKKQYKSNVSSQP